MLHIEWAPDVIVLRIAGHDSEVQNEEARLVDLEELATLRGVWANPTAVRCRPFFRMRQQD